MVMMIRAKYDHRFHPIPKFTKYNTNLRFDHKHLPEPKYNGLSRWQHVATALRKSGPRTFTQLWAQVKPTSGIRSIRELQVIMTKMRKTNILRVSPPSADNIKKHRWYFYLHANRKAWGFQYPEKMKKVKPLPNLPFKVFPYEKPTPINTYNKQTANFLKQYIEKREEVGRTIALKVAEKAAKRAQRRKQRKAEAGNQPDKDKKKKKKK